MSVHNLETVGVSTSNAESIVLLELLRHVSDVLGDLLRGLRPEDLGTEESCEGLPIADLGDPDQYPGLEEDEYPQASAVLFRAWS